MTAGERRTLAPSSRKTCTLRETEIDSLDFLSRTWSLYSKCLTRRISASSSTWAFLRAATFFPRSLKTNVSVKIPYVTRFVVLNYRDRTCKGHSFDPAAMSKRLDFGNKVSFQYVDAYPGYEVAFRPNSFMYQLLHPAAKTDPLNCP
jgi:hypothetical protein